jgi:transposase
MKAVGLHHTNNQLSAAIIGMGQTGHYRLNLSRWLAERQFQFVLVNPHVVKRR